MSTNEKDILVLNILEEGRWGGPQKRVLNVARRLRNADIRTIVYFSNYDSELFEIKLAENNVAYERVKLRRITKSVLRLIIYALTFMGEVKKIASFIRTESIDLVHVNGSFQIKGVLAANLAQVPVVWHMNDTSVTSLLYWIYKRKLAALPDGYIYAGERVRKYYENQLNIDKSYSIISAPVDTALFDSSKVSSGFSRERFGKRSKFVITMVGNWTPLKGHELFLDMAKIIIETKQYPDCKFLIVGAPLNNQIKYYERVRDNIPDSISEALVFLTDISDVRSVLRETDVYVCCSTFEASPTSVWEALSMGVPVVSTDVGDVVDNIRCAECGFVVDERDSKLMAMHVLELLEDNSIRQEFSRNARKTAVERFSLDAVVDKHVAMYKKII